MRRSLLTLIMLPVLACTASTGETTLAPTTTPPPSTTVGHVPRDNNDCEHGSRDHDPDDAACGHRPR